MLYNRNVVVNGRRTSVRFEAVMWEALTEIAAREKRTINEICSMVDRSRKEATFTSDLRIFILSYFHQAAIPEGHGLAGHGAEDVGEPPHC